MAFGGNPTGGVSVVTPVYGWLSMNLIEYRWTLNQAKCIGIKGIYGLYRTLKNNQMVEAAGIEPASGNATLLDLHA